MYYDNPKEKVGCAMEILMRLRTQFASLSLIYSSNQVTLTMVTPKDFGHDDQCKTHCDGGYIMM